MHANEAQNPSGTLILKRLRVRERKGIHEWMDANYARMRQFAVKRRSLKAAIELIGVDVTSKRDG